MNEYCRSEQVRSFGEISDEDAKRNFRQSDVVCQYLTKPHPKRSAKIFTDRQREYISVIITRKDFCDYYIATATDILTQYLYILQTGTMRASKF